MPEINFKHRTSAEIIPKFMNNLQLFIHNFRRLFLEDQKQLRHTDGERHDRVELRLNEAEPRLDQSELRLDLAEPRLDVSEKRLDDAEENIALADARIGAAEHRVDVVETVQAQFEKSLDAVTDKADDAHHEIQTTRQDLESRLDDLAQRIEEKFETLQARIEEKFTEFSSQVGERLTKYETVVDERIEERFSALETNVTTQNTALGATLASTFEQRTRNLDNRIDDRLSTQEVNLDRRVSAYEKGTEERLFTREKYVDDRLVRIGDDVIARTDLLLQHSEKRLDQMRRAMRILLEAKPANSEASQDHLKKFDALTVSRPALEDIKANVERHFEDHQEDAKAHYFKIIEWKKEAIECLQKFSKEDREVADYILSFVDAKNPDHLSYAETHLRRFVTTINRIPPPRKSSAKLLELGSCFFFTPAIKKFAGYTDITCADWKEGAVSGTVEKRVTKQFKGNEEHSFSITFFNAETEKFPYPDKTFQTIICCEMLEHFSRDPMHLFWEANRVLADDGLLFLTTPNITSIRAIEGLLTGYPPYLWMKYNLKDAAEQHYHEHTPETVKTFLEAAGFAVVELETEDVWAKSNPATLELLKELQFSAELRGDNIFVVGRKVSQPKERYPVSLYV